MMQCMTRDNCIIFMVRLPPIEVCLQADDPSLHTVLQSLGSAAFKQGGVNVQTIYDEIRATFGKQMLRHSNLQVAATRANTEEALRAVSFALACFLKEFLEHSCGTAKSETLELRTNFPMRPVAKNVRKLVKVNLILKFEYFVCDARLIICFRRFGHGLILLPNRDRPGHSRKAICENLP